MRAEKHLEPCTEDCKYNTSGGCAFSLRNRYGCYLEPEIRRITSEMLANALTINTLQRAKEFIRGKL